MNEVREEQVMARIQEGRRGLFGFVSNRSERSDTLSIGAGSILSIEYGALVFNTLIALSLVLFYLVLIKPLVFLPADLLMWEEGDFVGNIIKLNIGAPLYTDPADSNSLIYNPGAFLLTYAVAWVTGSTRSVVELRLIQLGFVFLATLLATICSRKLLRLCFPNLSLPHSATWLAFSFLALFLAATAPHTNKFVYTLHVDAAALLIVAFAVWTMVRYAEKPTTSNLLLMVICPALGFLTKQFLVSLVPVMAVFLLVLRPKEVRRLLAYIALSSALVGIAFALCYAMWGANFLFWTVDVMGGARKQIVLSPDANSISIARAVDHLARVWVELLVGVIGGWWMVRFGAGRVGWALASAWVVLIVSETFSSGAGWGTLYHFGPGALLGAVFVVTVLPDIWKKIAGNTEGYMHRLAGAILVTSIVAGIFVSWRVVPSGDRTEPRYLRAAGSGADLERYVSEIEREFDGFDPEKVLIGIGSWMYLRHDVLQKDRAVSLGDQPLAGVYENFDLTVDRIRNKTYSKILVHDLHSPFFLYDWGTWSKSSGFREALLANYTEIKTIAPAEGHIVTAAPYMYVGPVSVLVPRD